MSPSTLLSVQSSGRQDASVTRQLSRTVIATLSPAKVIERDLSQGIPLVDEAWIEANFTAKDDRTARQTALLNFSDQLVEELEAADTLVIGVPVYNFSVPAALKAWIDQVVRARRTFHYTGDGPRGLLTGKRAFLILASGGTRLGSPADFASGYLSHVLNFLGITDIDIIAADGLSTNRQAALSRAAQAVDQLKVSA